jgi:hypothetical protein
MEESPAAPAFMGAAGGGGLAGAVSETPLCRIGLIADVQYADRTDVGVGFWGRQVYPLALLAVI